jgi:rubredoxin-NAD+ reductase
MHPIIIIGSGMAGYSLAREYRKLNTEQELILVTADDGANYSKPMLSNALASKRLATQIAQADAEKMAAQLQLRIINHAWLQRIDSDTQCIQLKLSNGEQDLLHYSQLVLALGASPIRLAIEGDAADQLFVVNHLNDYLHFRNHLDQHPQRRVLILGAGLIGCEFANDLRTAEHEVIIVDLAAQALNRLLPPPIAPDFQRELEQIGIRFALQNSIRQISQHDQHYLVTLSDGQQFLVDAVLSAIGLQPNIALAQSAGLAVNRGICTNTLLQSSVHNIYAIGDCAEVNGTLLPYVMPLMQQARALAKTLTGAPCHVHYPAMPVAVKTPAVPLTVLAAPQDSEIEWQTEQLEDGLIAQARDRHGQLRGFVLLGATAAKQRIVLSKQVPDLFAAQPSV